MNKRKTDYAKSTNSSSSSPEGSGSAPTSGGNKELKKVNVTLHHYGAPCLLDPDVEIVLQVSCKLHRLNLLLGKPSNLRCQRVAFVLHPNTRSLARYELTMHDVHLVRPSVQLPPKVLQVTAEDFHHLGHSIRSLTLHSQLAPQSSQPTTEHDCTALRQLLAPCKFAEVLANSRKLHSRLGTLLGSS